jgi:hypothetical protein
VIDRGKVIEAAPWSDEGVEFERQRARATRARFHLQSSTAHTPVQSPPSVKAPSYWRGLWGRVFGRS